MSKKTQEYFNNANPSWPIAVETIIDTRDLSLTTNEPVCCFRAILIPSLLLFIVFTQIHGLPISQHGAYDHSIEYN